MYAVTLLTNPKFPSLQAGLVESLRNAWGGGDAVWLSPDEAVEFLAEKVRFEPYAAELEVGMYVTYPTYVLGYLIGMQELMAIREEWVAKYGEPSPPSEFYDRLLSIGSLPPVLVRESLFGEDEQAEP